MTNFEAFDDVFSDGNNESDMEPFNVSSDSQVLLWPCSISPQS